MAAAVGEADSESCQPGVAAGTELGSEEPEAQVEVEVAAAGNYLQTQLAAVE